jgi:putative oxidoreductase
VVTNEAGNFPAFPPMLAGGTVDLFASEYKLPILPPDFAASLAATGELVASALLILGLAARLSAAGLLAMAAVIQVFVYPGNWPEHLLWAAALGFIISRGPGAISLDRLIWRR